MKFRCFVRSASITAAAILLMVGSAHASVIAYTTNAIGTGFSGGASLVLAQSSGAGATLTYIPNAISVTGIPSNVNYGDFLLQCPTCTTLAGGVGATFDAFTFDLVISDITHGATGKFVGTSAGGMVYSDLSGLTINWAPLSLGPSTNNALSGSFGTTIFSTTLFTGLAAPNSGSPVGDTTVQGFVSVVPEPASLGLIFGGLLGLGMLRRKGISRS